MAFQRCYFASCDSSVFFSSAGAAVSACAGSAAFGSAGVAFGLFCFRPFFYRLRISFLFRLFGFLPFRPILLSQDLVDGVARNLDFYLIGYADDEIFVVKRYDRAVIPPAVIILTPAFRLFRHFLALFLLLFLRTPKHEIENDYHEDNRPKGV